MIKKLILLFLLITTPAWGASLTLNWTDNSDNETGFKIERRLGTIGTFARIIHVGVNVQTFVDTPPDNQGYCYQVRAFNTLGESGPSNIACSATVVLPPVSGIPVNPSGLTVTPVSE